MGSEETEGGAFARGVRNAIRNPRAVYRLLFYVVTGVFVVPFLFPVYWLAVVAVTPPGAVVDMGLLPKEFGLGGFRFALGFLPFFRYVFNSVVIVLLANEKIVSGLTNGALDGSVSCACSASPD